MSQKNVIKRQQFRFAERLRVRWSEIDAQGIVFNGHYLNYFDAAVGGYWRSLALPYGDTMSALDGELFVRKSTLEYVGSARYDELLEVGVRRLSVGTSSMTLQCAVFRGDELLVHGELVYVLADPATQTSKPIPAPLRQVIDAYEAGEPVVEVRVGDWAELGEAASAIRTAVFVHEQKIPIEMEWDEADASCLHAVAFNRFGQALATGRLLEHVPGVAKIGRMAVMRSMRGSRVGREVLDALMRKGRELGYSEVLLHAQLSALGFYLRAGFVERGEQFEEAGIGHVEMVRSL
ncbi:MAG TPA: YbgC/FadM family acyl-CoA thioesterase [Burkholderiaceae bacterium]|jgi:YbgC/YbaW family acyl-CoA thioester hydrolase